MKFMKKFTLAVAAAASVILLAACGNSSNTTSSSDYKSEVVTKGKLTIGLEGTYKPYSYRENGKLTGFEVELGRKIADKLDLKANFVPTKWDSLIAGLGSGKFDTVLNNITPTPERKKAYLFSTPYIYSHYVLISKSGSAYKTLKDIKGKKVVDGTGTDNATVAKNAGATIVPNGDFVTSLQMIKQGRADATVNAAPSWYAYKKDNATDGLQMSVIKDSAQEPGKISALIAKKDTALQKKVNKAIAQLRKDGELKKLSVKYFGTDITK